MPTDPEERNRTPNYRRFYRGVTGASKSDSQNTGSPSANASRGGSSFSLKDAVKNSEREHNFALSNVQLRHKTVQFVSAGTNIPIPSVEDSKHAPAAGPVSGDQAHVPNEELAAMNIQQGNTGTARSVKAEPFSDDNIETGTAGYTMSEQNTSQPLFAEDKVGFNGKVQTGLPNPKPRSPSPVPSNSSEEIVFQGRNPTATANSSQRRESYLTPRPIPGLSLVNNQNTAEGPELETGKTADAQHASLHVVLPAWNDTGANWSHQDDKKKQKKKSRGSDVALESILAQSRRPWKTRRLQNQRLRELDDKAFEDYILNMVQSGDTDALHDPGRPWARGLAVDDDQDVFMEAEADSSSASDGDENDDGESDDEDDSELESEYDEYDLVERRKAAMTDEHIARILSKQEELGLGSADIVLFDGVDDGEDDDFDVPAYGRTSSIRAQSSKMVRAKKSGKKERRLEEQPYGDFDVMDFDRPSLQLKSRRKGPLLAEELSDEDLRVAIEESWEADRQQKRLKKQEREELRAQGLLGRKKKKGKADLPEQYLRGMSKDQMFDEIRDLLMSSDQSRALPPLEKMNRKMLHVAARSFYLNTKSFGKGKFRHTVLYKTAKTVEFDDARAYARAEAILSKEAVFRRDKKSKGTPWRGGGGGGSGSGGGGGGGGGSARYRDGDIVGFSAPELGSENRGRAMLEKMGWSQGMGLGSTDNKGILQPIQHVVKNSKSGLG